MELRLIHAVRLVFSSARRVGGGVRDGGIRFVVASDAEVGVAARESTIILVVVRAVSG